MGLMDAEINIEDFHFQSHRKYMTPIYWKLRHAELLSDDEKLAVLRSSIRQFFVRIRLFINLSIEQVAERLKVTVQEIESFESGSLKSPEFERAYCDLCHAWFELEYFERRVREFQNPDIREKRNDLGFALLRSFGILMPDFKLQKPEAEPAKVLQIHRQDFVCIE